MLTIDDLKNNNLILLECISGSRAYGLDTKNSDTDIKGVFYLPKTMYYGLHQNYIAQVNDATNDNVYYELGRFIELLLQNNPNMMELLATPKDKILYRHDIMDKLDKKWFISKLCQKTFAGFANSQIKKATGLNKKINNPMSKEKKSVLDFCVVFEHGQSINIKHWLKKQGLTQRQIGLAKMTHAIHTYALYIDTLDQYGFCGITKKTTATDVCVSSIPKGLMPSTYLSFNQMGYSKYCQDYKNYWEWVTNRNDTRYQSTLAHDKQYDAKNMMHTVRLLQMAYDIATLGEIVVKRTNRDELLTIKQGGFDYDELTAMISQLYDTVQHAFEKSPLPEYPDKKQATAALIAMRNTLYHAT